MPKTKYLLTYIKDAIVYAKKKRKKKDNPEKCFNVSKGAIFKREEKSIRLT